MEFNEKLTFQLSIYIQIQISDFQIMAQKGLRN